MVGAGFKPALRLRDAIIAMTNQAHRNVILACHGSGKGGFEARPYETVSFSNCSALYLLTRDTLSSTLLIADRLATRIWVSLRP